MPLQVQKKSPILKEKKQNKGPIVAFSNATIGPRTIPTCGNTPLLVQHQKKIKKKTLNEEFKAKN